jgi:hypothetical protein
MGGSPAANKFKEFDLFNNLIVLGIHKVPAKLPNK